MINYFWKAEQIIIHFVAAFMLLITYLPITDTSNEQFAEFPAWSVAVYVTMCWPTAYSPGWRSEVKSIPASPELSVAEAGGHDTSTDGCRESASTITSSGQVRDGLSPSE